MGQSVRHANGTGGDQFYVTHCAVTDSVLNNPGYTVRAASANEPTALDAAFHYPPYELPIDMWRDLPTPALAPRRLARTKNPKGGVWAVHSAYLAKDTVDRDRSYFSHLLLLPDADPADVLRSWGAGAWATHYPPGAAKALAGGAPLPVGALVSDAALTAFLGDEPFGPTELSATVCPERLRGNANARRELFARMLRAMLVLAEEESEARRRLYVHAEPGLVALLLYGCVRLLPPAVTDDLTFSTFEAHHRNIRDYKLAEVVGTYLGAGDRGLDPDLGTTRGIALDTFVANRSSPELRTGAAPEGVSVLVDLAARADWELLPVVRRAIGEDPSGLPKAGAALVRARALARVDAGSASVDDLLALQADKHAAEELKSRAANVWAVVKPAALARADVRTAFRDLIAKPDHLRELWEEAFEALLKEDFRKWDVRWAVVRAAAGADNARRLLDKMVGREKNEHKLSKLPTDVRNKLRTACADVALFPPRALLVPVGLGELETLLRAQPDWAGYTAFILMAADEREWLAHVPQPGRDQMRTRARAFLFAAPPAAVAAYVRAARPFLDDDPSFLAALFTPYSDEAAALMDKLLAAAALEPTDWQKVRSAVGLLQDDWGNFLLEKDRLASLLVGFGGEGAGADVWGEYLGLLTPALVSPDLIEVEGDDDAGTIHEWERKVHAHLRAAAAKLTAADAKLVQALPAGGVARLFAANGLVKWADDATTIPRDAPDEVPHACDTFEVERLGLVRVAFKKAGGDRLSLPEHADKLAPVVELFRVCFPVDGNFNTARRAATEAIRLSAGCPDRTRGALQAHLILACVPDIHFAALLDDTNRQHALDPFATARIRERLAKPAKKAAAPKAAKKATAPEYVPPEPESESEPEPEPELAPRAEPFADEEEDEDDKPLIDKPRKKGGKASYKKSKVKAKKKSGCLGAVLFVVVVCALVARAI